MANTFTTAIPLVVAFLGAGLGAYFAFLKTRKERLWSDRYDALRNDVLNLETIQTHFETREMHEIGVQAASPKETEQLENDWPNSRCSLRASITMLRLLFKDDQIRPILEVYAELNQAFLMMFGGIPPQYPDLFGEIAKQAERGIDETIKVAQNYCL